MSISSFHENCSFSNLLSYIPTYPFWIVGIFLKYKN
nr:MAG TPA: hypothetical protein [Caudoviricetes sp.]